MKTTPKTKTTKTTKTASPKEYIGVVEILKQHKDSLINIGEAINGHVVIIDEHSEEIENNCFDIQAIQEQVNATFWMAVIGIAVAITFAGVAIFRR